MTHDDHELLSALLDRERVDPDALARVLATPEGCALLVDFVRVRHTLHMTSAAPHREASATLVAGHGRAASHSMRAAGRAAAAVLLLMLGGLGGAWLVARQDASTRAPEPTRIVRLTPVDQPATGGAR